MNLRPKYFRASMGVGFSCFERKLNICINPEIINTVFADSKIDSIDII